MTLSNWSDGNWETFEINRNDDFETFNHRESQPLEGRGIVVDQDVLNKMIEEINNYIQKIRYVKKRRDSVEAVHIVTSESVAGSLRGGLDGPKTVIGFPDSFSMGPLWKLDEKTGQRLRNEWLFEHINFELEDYEYEHKITNTLREMEEIADHVPIYVWYGNNSNEQTALRFYLYLLRKKTNKIFLMNTSELYERYIEPVEGQAISYTGQIDSDTLRVLFDKGKGNALLSEKKRLQLQKDWERLARTKDVLRLWNDGAIRGATEDYYDLFILETIEKLHGEQETKEFIKTGSVIVEIVTQMNASIDLYFVEYRIRHLVYSGVLELKGIPKSMRHYSIKLR